MVASTSWLPAPMTLPAPTVVFAAQDDVRLERHVLAELDGPVEVGRRRIAHRDAGPHVRLVQPDPKRPFRRGELRAIVDAGEPAVVLEGDGADEPAVLAREPDQVGQVQLAGGGRRRQRDDPATQPGGIEGVQPRVDLVPRQLVGTGVARLDDVLDGPELPADDPSELRRLGRVDARQRDRSVVLATRLEDRVEVGTGHQRDVARQHEDLGGGGRHDRERRREGIASAARDVLQGEHGPIGEDVDDRRDGRREDDHRPPGGGRGLRAGPGVEGVGEHRPPAQRVEDLGHRRAHPRAEAGGQHDGDRAVRRCGTWGVHEGRRRRARVAER